jgi:hypothetical protein
MLSTKYTSFLFEPRPLFQHRQWTTHSAKKVSRAEAIFRNDNIPELGD